MVDMDLTSLITKIKKNYRLNFFFVLLALLCAGCAENKIRPLREAIFKKSTRSKLIDLAPTKDSTIFLNKANEYGLGEVEGVGFYAVDVNFDGHTDLVVMDDFVSSPKFYLFDHNLKKFILSENPFPETLRANYLLFADFNRDGVYDVIIGQMNQKTEMTQYPSRVFKGVISKEGKLSYSFVANLPVEILPTSSIVAFDYDLDGELDLYLGNWFKDATSNPLPVADILLKGKGFEFTNVSHLLKGEYEFDKEEKIYPNITPTFGATVCDVDRNGFPDILTNNSNGYFNKMWMNQESIGFDDIASISGYAADSEGRKDQKGGGNSFFSLCGDYNNDSIVDIVLGNLSRDGDPANRDRSAILTGRSKTYPPMFYRSEFYLTQDEARWSQGNRRGAWIDYNLDGLNDLMIANMGFPPSSRLIFFEQLPDHAYEDKAREYGLDLVNPSGIVTLDINNDGVMDFLVGQNKARAGEVKTKIYLFENQTPRNKKGSLRVHLRGQASNYYGISSSVELITDKNEYWSEANYNHGGFSSQNEEGVYFAFDEENPKKLNVRWSYGVTDKLGRLRAQNQTYDLSRLKGQGKHLELNLCQDGRILEIYKKCY